MVTPKDSFGGEAIVRDAEQAGIGGGVLTAERLRVNVIDLQEGPCIASHACLADERALFAVPRDALVIVALLETTRPVERRDAASFGEA